MSRQVRGPGGSYGPDEGAEHSGELPDGHPYPQAKRKKPLTLEDGTPIEDHPPIAPWCDEYDLPVTKIGGARGFKDTRAPHR